MKRGKIIVLILLAVLSIGIASAFCCEKTKTGAWCQDELDKTKCDSNFEIGQTACSSTSYCKPGTCVDKDAGTCLASPKATCDSALGGFWYDKKAADVSECKYGCCLIGDGASFIKSVECDAMVKDYPDVSVNFDSTIPTEEQCLVSANPEAKGACVFEAEKGVDCDITTKKTCQAEGKEFHEGFLCTVPGLSMCTMTTKTSCVEDRDAVYFVDSCNNTANVYDASKVSDVDYWTLIKDASGSDICGAGEANILSSTCGNCNYGFGSICGKAKLGESVQHGKNICKDLSCNYKGTRYEHGDSWCYEPIENFENPLPGQLSYRLYCYYGEVQHELCGHYREGLCKEDSSTREATCSVNRWQECTAQNNSKDCLNEDKRDCKVITGISLKDENRQDMVFAGENGEPIEAVCVPKYPPAFAFWDESIVTGNLKSPSQACADISSQCVTAFQKGIAGKWRAFEQGCFDNCREECKDKLEPDICESICLKRDCEDEESECMQDAVGSKVNLPAETALVSSWALGKQQACSSLGDCGVKGNYKGGEGYNSWQELFIGNYTRASLPNANSHK